MFFHSSYSSSVSLPSLYAVKALAQSNILEFNSDPAGNSIEAEPGAYISVASYSFSSSKRECITPRYDLRLGSEIAKGLTPKASAILFMCFSEGVLFPKEELKAEDPMDWIRWMNAIVNMTEEFVLQELVYA